MAVSREKMIAELEKSPSVETASKRLGISTAMIWKRLKRYDLKIVKVIKVVKR